MRPLLFNYYFKAQSLGEPPDAGGGAGTPPPPAPHTASPPSSALRAGASSSRNFSAVLSAGGGAERLRALPGHTGRLARSRSGYPPTTSLTIPTPYPLRGGCAGPAHPPLPTPCSVGHFSEPQGPGRARRRRVRGGARRGAERGGGGAEGAGALRCHCLGGCQSGGERPGIGAGLVTQMLCAHIQG